MATMVTRGKYISRDDGEDRGDISVDGGRCRFWSHEISQSSSRNCGETVDGYWRGGYRFHTGHYSSHNPWCHGRLFLVSIASIFFMKSS